MLSDTSATLENPARPVKTLRARVRCWAAGAHVGQVSCLLPLVVSVYTKGGAA